MTADIHKPFVSFCMSTYKRPDFLSLQLKSILNQTFTDFEIVISDNDPEGSGERVVNQINDKRIKYTVNEQNLGMVKSFNSSLSRAEGSYIVMITDDDPVYPDMLQTLYDLSVQYPGYGVYQGGCEILCYTQEVAAAMRAKVGVNSCLSSSLDWKTVVLYSAQDFPYVFFNGEIGSLLLWSTGMVRRDIAIQTGGMPDYGTEFFTDHAYNVANCSHSGMVYINKALGHQAIHGDNFGFNQLKNLSKYEAIPDSFSEWIKQRLQYREDWPALKIKMEGFIGRALVEFSFFIKKSIEASGDSQHNFNQSLKKVFSRSYLKKWKLKYNLMSRFPATFQLMLNLKSKIK